MKLRNFLDKLLYKLGEGDLHYVASQLKSYFQTIQQDNFWIEQSEEILDSLKEVTVNADYTEETRKLKISEVREELQKIIATIKDRTNVESEVKALPNNLEEEEFEGLVDLQQGTLSLKTKGGKGTIERSGKFLILGLILLVTVFSVRYYFDSQKQQIEDIANCDCSKFDFLKGIVTDEVLETSQAIDSLDLEVENLEINGLDQVEIQQKQRLLQVNRIKRSKLDSLKGLILPEIESLIEQCPFIDCNINYEDILKKTN